MDGRHTEAFAYPIDLEPDGPGWLVTSPDWPPLTTDGATVAEALAQASDALTALIAHWMDDRQDLPEPSQTEAPAPAADGAGRYIVAPPLRVAAKAALYRAMRRAKVSNVALARRLGVSEVQVRRMLDIGRQTNMDDIDRALRELGEAPVLTLRRAA